MGTEKVHIWEEKVIIPTYLIGKPDKNPMFLEKRVYQGSSGVVYPLPVIETIENEKKDIEHDVVFLENEYLKIMVMPSLGGRIQMLYDKTNDFHVIYYNQVIKPALVGLTGPWISGGIEFNWPQHHRPSTYDPVDYSIEAHPDGSMTLWVSEIERMFRTKGMAGFTLYPGKAFLEINVKLYNRTAEPQTFLWWANPAMAVNKDYQSIFPPDVHAVFDHGKRDVSTFPIATGKYYKMDYSAGVDISRFKNIPVPTSFMAAGSKYDFMGGYDHGRRAGMLHYANHHVSPGKKQWVWGCGDFGDAWHRNLTDEDGPYVELMTGVYTDNQPDFSWLMPYEEKTFTQYFFPYKLIGAVKNANHQVAVNLEICEKQAEIGVYVTSALKKMRVELSSSMHVYLRETIDLNPAAAYIKSVTLREDQWPEDLILHVLDEKGRLLISYRPEPTGGKAVPDPASPIPEPEKIATVEELYLAGLHLEQYRHATYRPQRYYEEGIRRDPGDIRCNNALGLLLYRRGQFKEAETYFRAAILRQTRHNPNPYDGEPYYNLGLSLFMQNRLEEAYEAFFKATWNAGMLDAAYFALARIAAIQGNLKQAIEHVEKSLIRNYHNHKARHLKTILLRMTGQLGAAEKEAVLALELDRLDFGAMFELCQLSETNQEETDVQGRLSHFKMKMRGYVHNYIEIALDYRSAGLTAEACKLLKMVVDDAPSEMDVYPIVYYALGCWGYPEYLEKAAKTSSDYCFPHRLESFVLLQESLERNPEDAKGWYYLGNFLYSRQRYDAAIQAWEKSADLDNSFPTVFRNLGLGYYNKKSDRARARKAYETAYALDCSDARLLYELDQLYKKMACPLQQRKIFLEQHSDMLNQRDDLYIEYICLLNQTGENEKALKHLLIHNFHPWEGGEGKVTSAYVFALTALGKICIQEGRYQKAVEYLQRTEKYPENLGEGKLHGQHENDIHYFMGLAFEGLGEMEKAHSYFEKATRGVKELGNVMYYNDQPPEQMFYQGLALEKLGHPNKARDSFNRLLAYGQAHLNDEVKIDYFAVSLPDFLIFDEDLTAKNQCHCRYLTGLGWLGLKNRVKARQEFEAVLLVNPAHIGADVHSKSIDLQEILN